jgi:hypothetical protein
MSNKINRKNSKNSKKDLCHSCQVEFTISTLKKWGGHCKKCFDIIQNERVPTDMVIDKRDRILPTIGEHRQSWMTYYHDRFETQCPGCNNSVIDVFNFQSDFVDGSLQPLCKECVHSSYWHACDKLNRQVWMEYIGKQAEIPCPIGCHNRINVFNFVKGHIVSEYHGGTKTVDNLYPICAPCNTSMGTEDMRTYSTRFRR